MKPDNAGGHDAMAPEDTPELRQLYADFESLHIMPLWTQIGDLMPQHPCAAGGAACLEMVQVVSAGRALRRPGAGRARRRASRHRAGQPGLGRPRLCQPRRSGRRSSISGPKKTAPEHRHAQNAFRFVVEGEGVWTVVNGDPVRMSRGDFLLTPGWNFHGHHNDTDKPMAWIDGLDIPFSYQNDVGFFEFGPERVTDYATPEFLAWRTAVVPSRACGRLSGLQDTVSSPIGAYRWEHTDRALTEQLLLEDEGHPGDGRTGSRRHTLR